MKLSHFFLVLMVVAIWGSNFVAIKIGTETIPPVFLAGLRMFLTGFPLIFFVKRPEISLWWVSAYGLSIFSLNFGFLFAGMKHGMSAGLTSLIFQTQIFFTIGLSVLFFKEKIRLAQILCAVLAFAGVLVIAANRGGQVTPIGLSFVLSACVCWALGNIISKKIGKVSMLGLVVWGGFISSIPLLILAYFVEGPTSILWSLEHLSPTAIFCIFYLVYPTTILAFSVWSWLLNIYSTTTLLPFTLLVPIFGILTAVVVLGESPEWAQVVGGSLVFLGIALNLFISLKTPFRVLTESGRRP